MNTLGDLAAFARDLAPHVDRLAIAVHRCARADGTAAIARFGLPNGGVLIDLRALLLGGPISFDDLATIERYVDRSNLATVLDEHVRQGMLEPTEGAHFALTAHGRALLEELTRIQGQAITALWQPVPEPTLLTLVERTTRVADAAARLPRPSYPAFHLTHAAPDPRSASRAHLLLTRLTSLRYLRADAHAAAWVAHQRTPPDAEPVERAAIEVTTNDLAAPPWAALNPVERQGLLENLAALPA